MTIPEFLAKLRQTPDRWYLNGGALRCGFSQCPIVVVHGRGWDSERFREAARELGLSYAEAAVIAQVADGVYGTREDLRQQLLAATVERSAQMDMTDPTFAYPKSEPKAVTKKRREKLDAKDERACREMTRKRDGGKCRIPGCKEVATELHHIIYRSKSKRRRWLTENCVWLCLDHHRLEHAGIISISGNADDEIIVAGDRDRLKFRL